MNTCCCGLKRLPSSIRHSLFVFLYLQFAVVAFSQPPPLRVMPIAIEEGLRFAIREGGRTVGSGVVIAVEQK